jgi:hypothetical protein
MGITGAIWWLRDSILSVQARRLRGQADQSGDHSEDVMMIHERPKQAKA